MHKRRVVAFRILLAFAALVVVIGSVAPANSTLIQDVAALGLSDRLEHFLAYALLAVLAHLIGVRRPQFWTLIGFVEVMGFFLEFVQKSVPGRSCDMTDALADTAGVLLGLFLGWQLRLRCGRTFMVADTVPARITTPHRTNP